MFDDFYRWFDAVPEPNRTFSFFGVMFFLIVLNAAIPSVGMPLILIVIWSRYGYHARKR